MVQHDFWFNITNSKELEKFEKTATSAYADNMLCRTAPWEIKNYWMLASNDSMLSRTVPWKINKYYWKLARNETRLHCSSCPTFQNDVSTFPMETRLEPSTTNVFRGRHLWPVVILQQRWPIFRETRRCWWHNRTHRDYLSSLRNKSNL